MLFRSVVEQSRNNCYRGTYIIHAGDRIAQAVIAPVYRAIFEEVDELTPTERGAGGYGSTGTQMKDGEE